LHTLKLKTLKVRCCREAAEDGIFISCIKPARVEEKVCQELHDGVLGRMFGVRMNLDGLNGFQDEMAVQQRVVIYLVKI
jgi:hypothetical protein